MTAKEKRNLVYITIPSGIRSLLIISDGWLVGGAIKDIINKEVPKDYDIIIPSENWAAAISFIGQGDIVFNRFGGLKFNLGLSEVDMWPDNLESYIRNAGKACYAFNMKKNILIETSKFGD